MQPQQSFGDSNQGAIVCTQCGAPMPREMRFCRACGNRLGEGPAEYTETVRFTDQAQPAGRNTTPYIPGVGAPLGARATSTIYRPRRRRLRGMTWVWIMLGLFFAMGGGMSMLKTVRHGARPFVTAPASASRSYFGVEGFKATDGGVT